MKDEALLEAIAAAGSVTKLAAAIGVKPQAVSQWRRVPTERVVAVEAATGVPRERLRADLFRAASEAA